MILLPKLRLGVSAFWGPECMQEISSLGIRHVNIPIELLNVDNVGAFRENAEKHKVKIEAVCAGSAQPECADLAATAGAQALCIRSGDPHAMNAVLDGAGLKYLIWEPAGMEIEGCRLGLDEIMKSASVPVKLAIWIGEKDVCERCRVIGKDAMIMIRNKVDLQMLGKAIDSLRTGGSRENLVVLDVGSDLKASVDCCRNFVRE